jgi:hypothetical protein
MIAERILWHGRRGQAVVRCSMRDGCAGVDLQIVADEMIARRERHADRSSAYERARELRAEYARTGYAIGGEEE